MDYVNVLSKKISLGLIFSASLVSQIAYSANDLKPRVLKVCTVDWPPFTVIEGKQIKGSHTLLVEQAIEKLGFPKPEVNEVPWKRCLQLVESGQYDIVYSVSKNEEREKFLLYPDTPLQTLSYSFMVKEASNENWSEGLDVSSLPQPIGVPAGYSVAEKLRAESNVKLDESARDDEMNMNKLSLGRVGTIIIETTSAKLVADKMGLEGTKLLSPAYSKGKEYYVGISKKIEDGQALKEGIDQALSDLLKAE